MKKMIMLMVAFGACAALTARAEDASENFKKVCIICHGEDGKGATKMGEKIGCKDFTDPKVQEKFTDDQAFKAIKEGLKVDEKTRMKAYGDKLSDAEIKALVELVRKFKK